MTVVAELVGTEVPSRDVPKSTHTPLRNLRMEDDVWFPALRIAFVRGEPLTRVIGAALVRYISRNRHIIDDDPDWPARVERYKRTKHWD